MALTLDALQTLDTIVRKGSFAAAAAALGKVPSALTYTVRKLEGDLDVLLFDRRGPRAQLTPAGRELLDEGHRVNEPWPPCQPHRAVGDGAPVTSSREDRH